MLSESQRKATADAALRRMVAGERVVLSCETLDALEADGVEVRTFFNAGRAGVLDAYIGWIGAENAPECLFRDAYGYGHAEREVAR